MMKTHPYSFLTLILITLAFLFPGQAMAADIDAKLPDSDNTSSFQVKDSADSVLMKLQSGGDMGIGTTSPEEKLDVNGNVQISGTNGKLVFPSSHYDEKIELFKGGEEKIGTAEHQLKLISGGTGSTGNIAFFGGSAEVMRVETDGGNVGINTISPTEKLDVNSDAIRIRSSQTPASESAACDAGTIAWDSDYIYICVATNTWKRAAIAAWGS
jgi:hypothetical protein